MREPWNTGWCRLSGDSVERLALPALPALNRNASIFRRHPLNGSNDRAGAEQDHRDRDQQTAEDFVGGAVRVDSGVYPRKKAAEED